MPNNDLYLHRRGLRFSIESARAEIARGGLSPNRLRHLRSVIAAARRALHRLEVDERERKRAEWVAKRKEALRLRNDEHLSLAQIGKRMGGISKQRVSQWLGPVGRRQLTDLQAQVLKLDTEGKSLNEVAKAIGRSYPNTWNILNRARERNAEIKGD